MKNASIVHVEKITQFFKDGIETTPTADEKLLNAIFGTLEIKTTYFKTEIAVVKYKTEKELTIKFWEIVEQFKNFVHPSDLVIIK